MTISLALDPNYTETSSHAVVCFPGITGTKAETLLTDAEASQLLNQLVQSRWQRLACQDADPLAMLFHGQGKQWTVGWETSQPTLLLLTWEIDSWENKPKWSLYRNGQLIYEVIDEPQSAQQCRWLNQLLESPQLPWMQPADLIERLIDFRFTESQRRQAVNQCLQTMAVLPELFESLLPSLLDALEADLGNPEWPLLEVLKVHRLTHKNQLLDLLKAGAERKLIQDPEHFARLKQAVRLLQQDYLSQGPKIQPLFQPACQKAYQEFRTLITKPGKPLPADQIQPAKPTSIRHKAPVFSL